MLLKVEKNYPECVKFWSVLGLAMMVLIFFIAACMKICFGFVIKIVLITHQDFSCFCTIFTQPEGLLCFSLCSPHPTTHSE